MPDKARESERLRRSRHPMARWGRLATTHARRSDRYRGWFPVEGSGAGPRVATPAAETCDHQTRGDDPWAAGPALRCHVRLIRPWIARSFSPCAAAAGAGAPVLPPIVRLLPAGERLSSIDSA